MKIDCLNKRAIDRNKEINKEMDEVMDSNAVELWGCFELAKDKLLQYKNEGGDTIFAESALENIMVYAENSAYVNKPYVEERLNAYIKEGEAAEKPMGGLIGKLEKSIKEQDEAILNPTWLVPPINEEPDLEDDDYAVGGRHADLSIKD